MAVPASRSSAATRPHGWLSSRSASATALKYLHHNFVVALLNDLFGIQARGGCSCAGPYGHRLLAIGPARSQALREEIGHGCDGVKPGWTRVNLNYFISPAAAGYIAAAVELIAADGYRLLPDYRFDLRTGLWRHAVLETTDSGTSER